MKRERDSTRVDRDTVRAVIVLYSHIAFTTTTLQSRQYDIVSHITLTYVNRYRSMSKSYIQYHFRERPSSLCIIVQLGVSPHFPE